MQREHHFNGTVRQSILQKKCFLLGYWDLTQVILRPSPLVVFPCKDLRTVLPQRHFHRQFEFMDCPMMCSMYEGKQSRNYITNKPWDRWMCWAGAQVRNSAQEFKVMEFTGSYWMDRVWKARLCLWQMVAGEQNWEGNRRSNSIQNTISL